MSPVSKKFREKPESRLVRGVCENNGAGKDRGVHTATAFHTW